MSAHTATGVRPDLGTSRSSCAPSRAKRVVDIAIASAALVVLSPLLVVAALLVRITSRGPLLFRQERVGWQGRPMTMLKFRTMVRNADDAALREIVAAELSGARIADDGSYKLRDDSRITRVGRWLRATSIDELPQLFNVLQGSMSLVGPRPALPWEVELFPAEFRRRTDVLPGITGLWQVSGRSRLSTVQMLELDLEYVDNRSLRGDLAIILRTLPVLVRGDGAR